MKLVKQKHKCGCVIACLSMVTGMDYDTVLKKSGINPDFGAQRWKWWSFLKRHNYNGYWREYDPAIPLLPEPWAALHICSIYNNEKENKGHMVVVYLGKDVYDPCEDKVYAYKNLSKVRLLASIYPPYQMQPRLLPQVIGEIK